MLVWVTLAMAGAPPGHRTSTALADRFIDAGNPRPGGVTCPRSALAPPMSPAGRCVGRAPRARRPDARPALLWPRPVRGSLPDGLLVHQRLHLGARTGSWAGTTGIAAAGGLIAVARRLRASGLVLWFALTVDHRLRPHLRLPGRELDVATGLHRSRCASVSFAALTTAKLCHLLTIAALRRARLDDGARACSTSAGVLLQVAALLRLRASGSSAGDLAARRGVLQRQRLHRGDPVPGRVIAALLWRDRRPGRRGQGAVRRAMFRASRAATTS